MTDDERKDKQAQEIALRAFEESANILAVLFDGPVRKIALKARGDIREALGEART